MATSSQPVAISRPPRPASSKPQQVGCSPPGPSSFTPGGICFPPSTAPMLGSSPPSSSSFKSRSTEKLGPYAAAKKFWNRLIHDSSLIPDEYTVSTATPSSVLLSQSQLPVLIQRRALGACDDCCSTCRRLHNSVTLRSQIMICR